MAQKVKLKLFGNIYELKGDDQEVDLQKVAFYIEEKAEEVERAQPKLPPSKLMVLVVMSLGHELFSCKKRLEVLETKLNIKIKEISEKIDSRVLEKKD